MVLKLAGWRILLIDRERKGLISMMIVKNRKEVENVLKDFVLSHEPVEFKHSGKYFRLSVNHNKEQYEIDTVHYKVYFDSSWSLIDYVIERCGY